MEMLIVPKKTNKKQDKITILGGGASGMMAAISAARVAGGSAVRIVEKNDKLGRKILATGNGRCNFTNRLCTPADLLSSLSEIDLAMSVLEGFGVEETLDFFESIGIFWREESEGRIYPYSEQASALQEALLAEVHALGVEIYNEASVTHVSPLTYTEELKPKAIVNEEIQRIDGFEIILEDGRKIFASKLILATGGRAGSQYGSTGDGYKIAQSLGHSVIKPIPALVQLTVQGKVFQQLKGVRAKGKATLLDQKGKEIAQDQGEIQFTEGGLSGICIFNLSRFLRTYENKPVSELGYSAKLDLIPDLEEEALVAKLFKRREALQHRKKEEFLYGIVNKKLAPVILQIARVNPTQHIANMSEAENKRLAALLKSWIIPISGTKGWREAQVTSGGVNTAEIHRGTMESKITHGLYLAGEIIDIDGKCGGYNLQWAWTSGYTAGKCAAEAYSIRSY
jgi:predicted Rossmann fold flavoprotein